jgi:pyruvyl transferase EpsI
VTSRWQKARVRTALRVQQEAARLRNTIYLPNARCSADRQTVAITLAADYGNLGDLAITEAQRRFLLRRFPEARVVEVPIGRTVRELDALRRSMRADDVVTLIGGGNMGDHYDDIEYLRQLVVRSFPDNPIIGFPQTFNFSDGIDGNRALRRAQRAYRSHGHLALMARDPKSLEAIRSQIPSCQVVLAPDVVLTLDEASGAPQQRRGILVALRTDSEGQLAERDRRLVETTAARWDTVLRRDTHVGGGHGIGASERVRILEDLWAEFRQSRLVITDRLHGMIFAVITDTPCVALDSATGKVGDFYRAWLQCHPSTVCVDRLDPKRLSAAIEEVLQTNTASAAMARASLARQFATAFDSVHV